MVAKQSFDRLPTITPTDMKQEFHARIDHIIESLQRDLRVTILKNTSKSEIKDDENVGKIQFVAQTRGGTVFTLLAQSAIDSERRHAPKISCHLRLNKTGGTIDLTQHFVSHRVTQAYREIKKAVTAQTDNVVGLKYA